MTTPASERPKRAGDEAATGPARPARGQGDAYGRALRMMADDGAALCRAGDYLVAFVNKGAEGVYELADGGLVWREAAPDANVHLEVGVADAADGRFVPGLSVRVEVSRDGRPVVATDLPFVWHPCLYHYGVNAAMPGTGPFDVTVRIAPPRFLRHDAVEGDRYARPVEARFTGVEFVNDRRTSPEAQPRGEDAPTVTGAGAGLPDDWTAAAAQARTTDDLRARAPHDERGVPSSGR